MFSFHFHLAYLNSTTAIRAFNDTLAHICEHVTIKIYLFDCKYTLWKEEISKQTPRIEWELKSALKFVKILILTTLDHIDFE